MQLCLLSHPDTISLQLREAPSKLNSKYAYVLTVFFQNGNIKQLQIDN